MMNLNNREKILFKVLENQNNLMFVRFFKLKIVIYYIK